MLIWRVYMTFSTIDISFPEDLLVQIDQIADNEARTRDILVSDAVRMYIERKNEWQGYFNIGREIGSRLEISENDIMNEIKTYRQEKRNEISA